MIILMEFMEHIKIRETHFMYLPRIFTNLLN